jgi:predicted Zn-dependent peptidase
MITGEFMRILDGPFGIADVTIENVQNRTSNEYVNRYLKEVKAITPVRLQSLAQKYLKEEGFVTVIVGKP